MILSSLDAVYDKFKHLDGPLSDPGWCQSGDGAAIYAIAGELWRAVKEVRDRPRLPCEECIYQSESAEHDAAIAARARKEFAAAIVRERPDTMQATETMGDLYAWNGRTIMRVMNNFAQPEPKEQK